MSLYTPAPPARNLSAAAVWMHVCIWLMRVYQFGVGMLVLAWIVGRILTDRYGWSQWLFWIPTPLLLVMLCTAIVAARIAPRRSMRVTWRWVVLTAAVLGYFLFIEHRFAHRPTVAAAPHGTPGQLRVVHWNCQWPPAKPEQVISTLRELDGDVTFVTDLNWMTRVALDEDPLGTAIPPVHFNSLAVVSRLPIVNVRPLVAIDKIYVLYVELDATEQLGRTLKVYFVDLPSNPAISRWQLMARTRALMQHALPAGAVLPEPDIVLGDFNAPRGGAALRMMFPGLHEAYDQAGHGYGASWYRLFPLYHIDHIRLNDSLRTLRYDLIDPGYTRHVAQIAWISAAQ